MTGKNKYEQAYKQDGLYWGEKPSSTCQLLLKHIEIDKLESNQLLDLGSGEGRNALYLASHGFEVDAFDSVAAGLKKTKQLALQKQLSINLIQGDINNFQFKNNYNIIFSTGTLHYIEPHLRTSRFEYFKSITPINGYHIFSVLVEKPFIEKASDAETESILFKSGELLSHYTDWNIVYCTEEIFDCNSGGTPHRHCANRMIAQRVL